MNAMKLGNLLVPALLLFGSELGARVMIQGMEQGLLSLVLESSMRRIKTARRANFGLKSQQ